MDKFPLLWAGRPAGELTTRREDLYTVFSARCALPEPGLWCAWAVGEAGELRLGVLEPDGTEAAIQRRFSRRMTEPLGRLLRGELRPAAGEGPAWEETASPAGLFRGPWLRRQLQGGRGTLMRRRGSFLQLAIPWETGRPFPLTPLFTLAAVRRIGEGRYVVYTFDSGERPVPPGKFFENHEK